MGRGFDVPWVRSSKYHGYGAQYTMNRCVKIPYVGVRYTMGGVWYAMDTLSMVYWTSYPWYFEPPIQGILDPLPIVYRTHCSLYFNPLHMVYQSHYPWYFVKYRSRIQYTIWNFGTRVKFSSLYFESNHGSGFDIPLVRWVVGPKYHGCTMRCGFNMPWKGHFTPELIHVIMFPTCIRLNEY
jgi:hypothetical protein